MSLQQQQQQGDRNNGIKTGNRLRLVAILVVATILFHVIDFSLFQQFNSPNNDKRIALVPSHNNDVNTTSVGKNSSLMFLWSFTFQTSVGQSSKSVYETKVSKTPLPSSSVNSSLKPQATKPKSSRKNVSSRLPSRAAPSRVPTKVNNIRTNNRTTPSSSLSRPRLPPQQRAEARTNTSRAQNDSNNSIVVVVPPPPICRRPCQHYNNKILLGSRGIAGLNDRLYILKTALPLAGYLCARLYVARPKFWLSRFHNDGRELDIRMTWDDFVVYRFKDDMTNQSALVDWTNEQNLTLPPLVSKIKRARKYRGWMYVRTDNFTNIVKHLEQIESVSFSQTHQLPPSIQQQQQHQQQDFLWDIRANFYDWHPLLVNHMRQRHKAAVSGPTQPQFMNISSKTNTSWRSSMQPYGLLKNNLGCTYLNGEIPRDVVRMVQNIFDQVLREGDNNAEQLNKNITSSLLSRPQPWMGYFHVRRGDAISDCNTALSRVERFLNCSVGQPLSELAKTKKDPDLPKRQVVIFFSSDERKEEYRQGLAQVVKKLQSIPMVNTSFTVIFADLDQLGKRELAAAVQQGRIPAWRLGNLYLFRLISYVEWYRGDIYFRLEQRRSFCQSCNNIRWQLQSKRALSDYI